MVFFRDRLAEEMEVIESELVYGVGTLVQAFAEAKPVGLVPLAQLLMDAWPSLPNHKHQGGMLEPLLKMLALSVSFTAALAKSDVFVTALLNKPALHHPNALVRVNILKILSSLVVISPHSELLEPASLMPHATDLVSHDPSILVQEIASKLLTLSSSSSGISSRSPSPLPSPPPSKRTNAAPSLGQHRPTHS